MGCADIRHHSQSLRSPASVVCAGEAHLAGLGGCKSACTPNQAHRGHAPLGYVGVKVGHLIENSRLVRVTKGGEDDLLFKLPRTARTFSWSELGRPKAPRSGEPGEEAVEGR